MGYSDSRQTASRCRNQIDETVPNAPRYGTLEEKQDRKKLSFPDAAEEDEVRLRKRESTKKSSSPLREEEPLRAENSGSYRQRNSASYGGSDTDTVEKPHRRAAGSEWSGNETSSGGGDRKRSSSSDKTVREKKRKAALEREAAEEQKVDSRKIGKILKKRMKQSEPEVFESDDVVIQRSREIAKKLPPVVILAAVILLIICGIVIPPLVAVASITGHIDLMTMTQVYDYITQLDAELTEKIRSMGDENDSWYLNGAEVERDGIQIQTNADTLLLYLDLASDGELSFSDALKKELAEIHGSLYHASAKDLKAKTEDGKTTTTTEIRVTTKSIEAYMNEEKLIAKDEQEQLQARYQVGLYLATQELANPLGSRRYGASKRWGWYYDGSLHKRDGITISAPAGTPVYSVMTGTVTSAHDTTVTMGVTKESIYYEVTFDGILPEIEPGAVQRKDQIGTVSSGGEFQISISLNQIHTNPLFLLEGSALTTGAASDMAVVAATQIGQVGGQPYWSWAGHSSRVDWCAIFVSWCADQCGYLNSTVPNFSYCDTGITWFKSRGQWMPGGGSYLPSPGDIVFFDWQPNGSADHVGIVDSCDGLYIWTIEGNSGNAVRQRKYYITDYRILGYGIPQIEEEKENQYGFNDKNCTS